jgi:alkylated DNA repair protein alkB family protein 1
VKYPEQGASFFTLYPDTEVLTPKDPSTHQVIHAQKVLGKQLRWMTLGGQYDWTNKEYPTEKSPPFPPDIAALLRGIFQDMEPEAAIVNLYSPGDTLSIHRDVSEEVNRGLVSISLGCDAIFIIGLHDKESGETQSEVLRLRSGDAVYMNGESRFAWHGVPCVIPDTCPKYLESWPAQDCEDEGSKSAYEVWRSWMKNKRVNLNVRQMRD